MCINVPESVTSKEITIGKTLLTVVVVAVMMDLTYVNITIGNGRYDKWRVDLRTRKSV